MFDYLYGWLQDVSYYLILTTAVIYALPSGSYRKYVRFFTGLVLILMILTPVLDLFGMEIPDENETFEKIISEYENSMPKFAEIISESENKNQNVVEIEVEDIVIGP